MTSSNATIPVGTLGPKGAEAFQKRGIEPETAARFNVYTARKRPDGTVEPHESGNIIVFPFYEHGVVVNAKFRAPGKKFWQQKDGKSAFWNSDALDDPALADGRLPLVITEGEIDALTAIDCGWPLTVSVPDGAPPVIAELKPEEEIDDRLGKFNFMYRNRERQRQVLRFIIAVDSDEPGKRLAEELVRRLGAARCCFVRYPEGCKDLNDVLMKHGADQVRAVLMEAKPYPVRGLYQLNDYPDLPDVQVFSTGFSTLDQHFQLFAPSFTVITGIPGHGKSTFMTQLMINAARIHGWRSAIFTPEMSVVPHMRKQMRSMLGGDIRDADEWLHDHIIFLDHIGHEDEDEDLSLKWLLQKAEDAVYRHGVRILVIDPWNEVEHNRTRDETATEYIGRAIRLLKRVSKRYNLALFVLAHPTKEVGVGGKIRVPSLYDVDGSAHWFNKPDVGLVIHRPDCNLPQTAVHINKVRFRGTGKVGKVMLSFNEQTSRYGLLNE